MRYQGAPTATAHTNHVSAAAIPIPTTNHHGASSAPRDETDNERPAQVALLLDGERPGMSETRKVLARDKDPVADIEQRGHGHLPGEEEWTEEGPNHSDGGNGCEKRGEESAD